MFHSARIGAVLELRHGRRHPRKVVTRSEDDRHLRAVRTSSISNCGHLKKGNLKSKRRKTPPVTSPLTQKNVQVRMRLVLSCIRCACFFQSPKSLTQQRRGTPTRRKRMYSRHCITHLTRKAGETPRRNSTQRQCHCQCQCQCLSKTTSTHGFMRSTEEMDLCSSRYKRGS